MKKALITGASGFVGSHLIRNLEQNGYHVWCGGRNTLSSYRGNPKYVKLDFSNQGNLAALLEQLQPEVIFHLSGQSSVQQSWKRIPETFMSNVTETIHLYESVTHTSLLERAIAPESVMLIAPLLF